jgi:hypothetical protein
MRNTADVIGGKPIAVLLQSISGVRAIIPLVTFYDINGGKREVLFFYFVLYTTRDNTLIYYVNINDIIFISRSRSFKGVDVVFVLCIQRDVCGRGDGIYDMDWEGVIPAEGLHAFADNAGKKT